MPCERAFFPRRLNLIVQIRSQISDRHALRCKRLVLTHMNSDMLAHSMDLSIEPAHDGLAITL